MPADSGGRAAYKPVSSFLENDQNGVEATSSGSLSRQRSEARKFLAQHASEGQNFTLRGILVGLGVGLIICFSVSHPKMAEVL